ncbi:TDT family transporter [Mycolicibacterium hippocampi]|uniref:C4-dicarboxylate ABC transporter n=1 Tax=Mycolicibacterium hippocampi TaxID=659824 RepID=A0A7I9ZIP7_9MYCO|nr:TDT family transporter [Mycolicibacterium hippocampi]GFH00557.1 C4-dicarboxylate ABC transporter [Mycolicibacterium hippocampi]
MHTNSRLEMCVQTEQAQTEEPSAVDSGAPPSCEERGRPGIGFFHQVTPNLFASVMGTGIVATVSARFIGISSGFAYFGTAVWILASMWLLVLIAGFTGNWLRHREQALALLHNPVNLPFYGTIPMALLTVGSGAMLFGPAFFGSVAVWIAGSFWILGTLLGIITAVAVPVRAVLSTYQPSDYTLPSWMLPVVPPMVSATTGAGLLDHIPDTGLQTALRICCYSLFGMALIVGMLTLAMIYSRLVCDGALKPAIAPTVWIPLGVIGQSIAAANFLGVHHGTELTGALFSLHELRTIGVVFGAAMFGFAVFWVAFAMALTAHGARVGMSFSLSWWSLVFPVGATALGLSALAEATGLAALDVGALCLYVALVSIWCVVAVGSIVRGHLAWWR